MSHEGQTLDYESPALTAELQALRADVRTSNIQPKMSNDCAAAVCCLGDSPRNGVTRSSVIPERLAIFCLPSPQHDLI
jgi:hypothetical protein